jgi:uncharacterized membrane protein
MKDIIIFKKNIKTFSFVFTFIAFIYPIKALFAYMENDLSYLGLITDDSLPIFLWMTFLVKFISNIIFFIGIFFLVKTLNFDDIKDIFSSEKVLLFKKTGHYFLSSASVGSLVIIIQIFDGKFAGLKGSNDFLFTLYFSLIIGFFFYVFSKILEKANELKQENDLTI